MSRRNLARTTAIAILVLVSSATAASAQMFVATGRDTLRGLPGVEVVIENVPRELEGAGLTTSNVRGEITKRLREAGVTIYASQSENPSRAKPYVYVHLNLVKLPGRWYAVAIQVHLRQTLQSPVTGSNVVDAMSWDKHDVLAVPAGQPRLLRGAIVEIIDLFIADWRAVH